jgi:hypothetical protein
VSRAGGSLRFAGRSAGRAGRAPRAVQRQVRYEADQIIERRSLSQKLGSHFSPRAHVADRSAPDFAATREVSAALALSAEQQRRRLLATLVSCPCMTRDARRGSGTQPMLNRG